MVFPFRIISDQSPIGCSVDPAHTLAGRYGHAAPITQCFYPAWRVCLRSVINGTFYVLQNGCARANPPRDFPPRSTVYGYFQRFLEDGTWARHDALSAMLCIACRRCKNVKGRKRHILVDTVGLLLRRQIREDQKAK